MDTPNNEYLPKLPYIISVVSGKGGVGKSFISSNLANQLSKNGMKVLVWDGDHDFPNLHLMFGVEPFIRSKDIFKKIELLEQGFHKINDNLSLLADYPSENIDEEINPEALVTIFKYLLLEGDYDFIIIDTSAGVNEIMLNYVNFSNSVMMIVNDEPSTLLDSYALSKILLNFVSKDKIKIVANNVIDSDDFEEIYNKLSLVTNKFLKIQFEAVGFIPYQRIVRKSILNQELATNYKNEDISFYFESLANYFINEYNVSEIII